MSDHAHDHDHTHSAAGKTLLVALLLTLGFSVLELIAGWRSGSLALLADAGHMVTDGATVSVVAVLGLLINLVVAWILSRSERNLNDWPQALKDLTAVAAKQGIGHVTFQPESVVVSEPIQFKPR